jgi:DNA-binding CsgD family transcriptional regulator
VHHLVRTVALLDAHQRSERHHRAAGVPCLEARNLLGLQAELGFGLHVHLVRPTEPVEVVGVERPQIHLQRIEHVRERHAVGLGPLAIDVGVDLRHADLEAREQAGQCRHRAALPQCSLDLRVQFFEAQACSILDVQLEPAHGAEPLYRRRGKDRDERLLDLREARVERLDDVQLTPRELATLRLIADGKANKEIASELGISERTVKTHLGHLFEKLGVTSRTEAVKIATRRGLVRLN